MNRHALACAAATALLAASPARAQTNSNTAVYTAVDAVSLKGDQLTVTGVVQGEQAATTRTFDLSAVGMPTTGVVASGWSAGDDAVMQTCTRFATLAIMKPGAFLFTVQGYIGFGPFPGCTLTRVTP
ncbi:MAG TPA: hypothetical protein VFP65_22295 [Anaeromyxobacteraceae bacterium]|nr:hypothetical protein [Anaeromyxobacteraceae bacterium]